MRHTCIDRNCLRCSRLLVLEESLLPLCQYQDQYIKGDVRGDERTVILQSLHIRTSQRPVARGFGEAGQGPCF